MEQNHRRAALARLGCIAAFVLSVLIVVGIAAYIELIRAGNDNFAFVGEGGLFTEAIWIPILFLVGSLIIPFLGVSAGLHALNNLEREKHDKKLLGAMAGNIFVFLPVFLTLSYYFVLFLNDI